MCEGCKLPTKHSFVNTEPVGIRLVDVIYECTRCGDHRAFGREHTGYMGVGVKHNDAA